MKPVGGIHRGERAGALRVGHGESLRQVLCAVKREKGGRYIARFARVDTMPTIPMSPMDLPMESSLPNTW